MDATGLLPLGFLTFFLVFLGIFSLAFYRPIWVFWLFIISLPLESVIISSNQIPISFRPFQVIGLMLFLATLVLIATKKTDKNLFELIKIDKTKFFKAGAFPNFSDILVIILAIISFFSLPNALNFNSTLKLNLVLLSFGMLYFLARFYFQKQQQKLLSN